MRGRFPLFRQFPAYGLGLTPKQVNYTKSSFLSVPPTIAPGGFPKAKSGCWVRRVGLYSTASRALLQIESGSTSKRAGQWG